jgi:hypothetical protein
MSGLHPEEAAGFLKPRFRVGQRVRPSKYGIESTLFSGTYKGQQKATASGVVQAVDEWNSPTVLWDYRKTADRYFAGFISPDRRRKK